MFTHRVALEFWIYVGVTGWEGTQAKVPDIYITVGGAKVGAACAAAAAARLPGAAGRAAP